LVSFGVLTGTLEGLLDTWSDARRAWKQRYASAAGATPRLPRLMNTTTSEPLDRIVAEGLANRSSYLIQVDAEALEELGVTGSASSLGMQAGRWGAQDRFERSRQCVGVAGKERCHRLGQDVAVPHQRK